MDKAFDFLFGRQLDEDDAESTAKKRAEYRSAAAFNPSDPHYDPQLRLKQRLRSIFPHVPFTPGLPPRRTED